MKKFFVLTAVFCLMGSASLMAQSTSYEAGLINHSIKTLFSALVNEEGFEFNIDVVRNHIGLTYYTNVRVPATVVGMDGNKGLFMDVDGCDYLEEKNKVTCDYEIYEYRNELVTVYDHLDVMYSYQITKPVKYTLKTGSFTVTK